ncbi:MAG TPA: hypothetical protein DEO60_03800 [Bacteroidales bacterium]|nr:hypothetical protein [Bacteroidales bacterium]HBZ20232.1 hypothetical protein [Bacteroidales bacterium]
MKVPVISAGLFLLISIPVISQDSLVVKSDAEYSSEKIPGGFIRSGFYTWVDKSDEKLYFPAAFSDLGLKLETGNRKNFRSFADIRFRYGTEFLNPVSKIDIREAWVGVNGKKWNFSAGQKIIQWGRCDFTNPTSKLSPINMISRSPDREDMNMGNLLVSANYYPWTKVKFEAVVVPYYRSSVLIIEPVRLPEYVVINQLPSLVTEKEMFSYALKADFHLKLLDWSLSWFEGYDPLPGTALTKFSLDLTQPIPQPFIELSVKPYKTRVLGIDFETAVGAFGLRGEAAWSDPKLLIETNEYVPYPEIKWVLGADWSTGIWRFTGEYSGKFVVDYTPSSVEPVIGTETDFSQIAAFLAIPGFNIENYVKLQVEAFNRLYNNQLKEYYNSAGMRVEADMLYGKLLPSVMTMYNFTSHDMILIPEVKIKPADGLAITIGAEIYSGRKGSLYDLVDDFMNGAYVSLRVDF